MRDAGWGMRKTVPCFPFPSSQTIHTGCGEFVAILEKVVRYAGYVKAKESLDENGCRRKRGNCELASVLKKMKFIFNSMKFFTVLLAFCGKEMV